MGGSDLGYLQDKSCKGVSFSKHSWQPHQSGPMSNMFDMIQRHISCHDICLGSKLRANSRENKYANHGYCQNLIVREYFVIYAFQVGLFHISVFPTFPFHMHAMCGGPRTDYCGSIQAS